MPRPVSLGAARQKLLGALPPPPAGEEDLAAAAALGRVSAVSVLAPGDLPAFDRALVDGYAVRCPTAAELRVGGEVSMGRPAPELPPGDWAVAVPTGGMLPAGTDAVVMQEDVERSGDSLRLRNAVTPGQNLVRVGSDVRAGEVVLPAGRRLRPAELAMLASAGCAAVRVWTRPRIGVLSTGDELVAAGAPAGPGQVPDSNAPALAAALCRDGAEPVLLGVAADSRGALAAALARGADCDALLCSGGSSVGERDFVQAALEEVLGVPPLFSGISIRPGRPTAAFVAGPRWAVALPGHAVSALVVYELLVREAVLRFGGESAPRPRGALQALLGAPVHAPADRDLFVRVRLADRRAEPLAGASATVGNLARADGLVHCPAGSTLEAGSEVAVWLLD